MKHSLDNDNGCNDEDEHDGLYSNETIQESNLDHNSKSAHIQYIPDYINHTNPPYLMGVFKKESTLEENIIVLIPLVSSASNVRFVVSTDGKMGFIKYEWPRILFDFKQLFDNDVDVQPKILCLQEALMK